MTIDISQFIGVTGIPLIEQIVQYLKENWRLPTKLAPLAALLVGVILNDAIAFALHFDLLSGVLVGLVAGFGSSFWHEFSKTPPATITQNNTQNA